MKTTCPANIFPLETNFTTDSKPEGEVVNLGNIGCFSFYGKPSNTELQPCSITINSNWDFKVQ